MTSIADTTRTQAQEMNRLAQEEWRRLCKLRGNFTTGDVRQMVAGYREQHTDIPECFRDSSDDDAAKRKEQRWRQRQGNDLVYGKPGKYGLRYGNAIARLRVLVGSEVQHRVLRWRDVPELAKYADVLMVQFDPILRRETDEILRSMMPEQCVYTVEWGESGLHSHILVGQGVTDLGSLARRDAVHDENLVTLAGYLGKRPLWTEDNAESYLIIKQAINAGELPGNRLPTRLTALGAGVGTGVTLNDIVRVLGHPLTRKFPARMAEKTIPARTTHSRWESEPENLPEVLTIPTRMSPVDSFGISDAILEREYEMVLAAQAEVSYPWTVNEQAEVEASPEVLTIPARMTEIEIPARMAESTDSRVSTPQTFDAILEREYEMVLAAQAEPSYPWTADEQTQIIPIPSQNLRQAVAT